MQAGVWLSKQVSTALCLLWLWKDLTVHFVLIFAAVHCFWLLSLAVALLLSASTKLLDFELG